MQIKVDYHFHPNLPFFLPILGNYLSKNKAKNIWKSFEKHGLDMVMITEHSFKHPKKTFEYLEKTQPKNSKTLIIPGVEVLTKEGTDMIVFAKDKNNIYSYTELLTPQKITTLELISFIKTHKSLHGITTHSYAPSKTGIIRNNGIETTKYAIKELGMVEGYNSSFTPLIRLFQILRFNKILKKTYADMLKAEEIPKSLIPNKKIIITGGSDAHHCWEMGSHINIEVDANKDLYTEAITNSGIMIKAKSPIYHLLPSSITILREGIMKKLKLYSKDKYLTKHD